MVAHLEAAMTSEYFETRSKSRTGVLKKISQGMGAADNGMTKHETAIEGMPIDAETAEIFSVWRADLLARIARTRLRFEMIGVDPEEIVALACEAEEFRRVRRAFTWGAIW